MGSIEPSILDLTVDISSFEDDAKKILKEIRPDWTVKDIRFKKFTDGITNMLMGCYLDGRKEDTVLIRVNGVGSELVIDRAQEQKTFSVLNAVGCAPPVFCYFNNGMAYGYFPGEPLDINNVRDHKIQKLIGAEMARLHAVEAEDGSPASFLRTKLQGFINNLPDTLDDADKQKGLSGSVPSKASLQREMNELINHLDACRMKSVFSHNDLLLKNIIYDSNSKSVKFIDYEYAFYNYEAFDLGNHFAEYAGIDEVNYDLYPPREEQLYFLRSYLESAAALQGKPPSSVSDIDVERFYVLTNKCACAAHFMWGVWGLIQAKHSVIDFDYFAYSNIRLTEYYRRKAEFFPLQVPAS